VIGKMKAVSDMPYATCVTAVQPSTVCHDFFVSLPDAVAAANLRKLVACRGFLANFVDSMIKKALIARKCVKFWESDSRVRESERAHFCTSQLSQR
jgi:hypothetical protein